MTVIIWPALGCWPECSQQWRGSGQGAARGCRPGPVENSRRRLAEVRRSSGMDASAFDPTVPFTRTEAITVGLTPRALAGAGFMRLQRNVYVTRTAPLDLSVRARAALVCAPRSAVISHHTAAVLWGGAVPESSEMSWRSVTIARPLESTGGRRVTERSAARRATTWREDLRSRPRQWCRPTPVRRAHRGLRPREARILRQFRARTVRLVPTTPAARDIQHRS